VQGGPDTVPLGTPLNEFALLAYSTVTNFATAPTLVTYAPIATTGGVPDDFIGVSPGTSVTGFVPNGSGVDASGSNAIYAAGYNTNAAVPATAQGQLTTAFNTLAGIAPTAPTVAGDLSTINEGDGGPGIFPPGVYKSTSTLSIAAGNLTLDGQNNPEAVFIFQVGSALTTTLNGTTGGNVILINGASACNIYWQVGSSATLGGATFYGNVLAYASVTINATTFGGRALASTGAVTIPIQTGSLITNPGGN
jgi:type VI secretion system secreted protein VgrG